MEQWFALILSGMFAYWLLSRSLRRPAETPLWLLWAILMLPPTVTFATVQITKTAPPLAAIAMLWLLCGVLYWRLTQPTIAAAPKPESTDLPAQDLPPLRSISTEDEVLLRECFPWSVYFLESIEYRPQAVVCRGKLRTDATEAYQTVQAKIAERFADKFFVLFQSGLGTQPFFVLVPDVVSKLPRPKFWNYLLAASTWVMTWITTSNVGLLLMDGSALTRLQREPGLAQQGWLYSLIILLVLSSKDIAKYWICRWWKIGTGLLYCVPLPFFPGTCGTLLQLRAPIPQRRALFDLGFYSLVTTLFFSIAALYWGLQHTAVVSLSAKSGILSFNSCNPRFSLLFTLLSKLALGKDFAANTAIDLRSYPMAMAAYLGFLMTAINILPFKRFDGGFVIHAMYGVRGSITIGQVTKILLLVLGFVQMRVGNGNGSLIFACLLMLFPTISDPTLNDVAEIDGKRDWLGLGLMLIGVLIFIPVTGGFARMLGV
jgi:hypothetical protein